MANKINIGNINIGSVKLGTADVSLYLGNNKLYPLSTPTFDGKWKATYSDSHTESAQCDSSSAITNEISLTDLVSAEIGDCVTSIGAFAFEGCSSLININIPSGVTTIGDFAFDNCSGLISITIPNSVTSIGAFAFQSCVSLTSVTIGSGVTRISNYAFNYCTGLTSITVNAITPPTLGAYALDNTNNCPIYVPAGSISAYQSSSWSMYASRIQAIPNS